MTVIPGFYSPTQPIRQRDPDDATVPEAHQHPADIRNGQDGPLFRAEGDYVRAFDTCWRVNVVNEAEFVDFHDLSHPSSDGSAVWT